MPRVGSITVRKAGRKWIVDVTAKASPNGRRMRPEFETKAEAEAEKERLEIALLNHGRAGFSLPADMVADAVRAAEIVKPLGGTLTEAATLYAEKHDQRARSVTFAELYDAYVMNPNRTRREKTLANYRATYNSFEPLLGATLVCDITHGRIRRHLATFTPDAAEAKFTHLRAWFNFAVKEGWVEENPLLRLDKPQRGAREIRTLTPEQIAKLLKVTKGNHPSLLAFAALGAFAGIRPDEIRRLRWSDVNLVERFVKVTESSSKVGRRRAVTISDNLALWLEACEKEPGLVVDMSESSYRRRWKECRKLAKVFDDWPQDVMRHSFASHHLAFHGDLKALEIEMGHTNTSTLRSHYLDAVSKKDAIAFWAITPKGEKVEAVKEEPEKLSA